MNSILKFREYEATRWQIKPTRELVMRFIQEYDLAPQKIIRYQPFDRLEHWFIADKKHWIVFHSQNPIDVQFSSYTSGFEFVYHVKNFTIYLDVSKGIFRALINPDDRFGQWQIKGNFESGVTQATLTLYLSQFNKFLPTEQRTDEVGLIEIIYLPGQDEFFFDVLNQQSVPVNIDDKTRHKAIDYWLGQYRDITSVLPFSV